MKPVFRMLALAMALLNIGPARSSALEFRSYCPTGDCFLFMTGKITEDDPQALRERMECCGDPATHLVIDSPGGNLSAGLELGRLFRELGNDVTVGVDWSPEGGGKETAECLSACAYAFLGGKVRAVEKDAKLGFHQFSFGESSEIRISASGAIAGAQEISSELVNYLVEMGVDPRIFVLAGTTGSGDMLELSRREMIEYQILPEEEHSAFDLEPYKEGVIAFSRTQVDDALNSLEQLSVLCRGGRVEYLITGTWLSDNEVQNTPVAVTHLKQDRQEISRIKIAHAPARTSAGKAYISVSVPRNVHGLYEQADVLRVAKFIGLGKTGSAFVFHKSLTAMDKKMLDAGGRLCID